MCSSLRSAIFLRVAICCSVWKLWALFAGSTLNAVLTFSISSLSGTPPAKIAFDKRGIGDHLSSTCSRGFRSHRLIVVRCVGHGLARRQCGQAAVGCALVRLLVSILAERHFAELQQQ